MSGTEQRSRDEPGMSRSCPATLGQDESTRPRPAAQSLPLKSSYVLPLSALVHVASYVIVGSLSAVVSLVCFHILYTNVSPPHAEQIRYLRAYLVSAEVATMFNFLLNDRFTFATSLGRARPWPVRCLRFHTTVINGLILTFIVSGLLHYVLSLPALVSQAVGIIIAFIFNFAIHHLWTYRGRPVESKEV